MFKYKPRSIAKGVVKTVGHRGPPLLRPNVEKNIYGKNS